MQDREGKIDGGTFIVEGNFKKDWGGTPGGDKIVFGKAEVTIPFEENQVVTKAELSLNKKVKKYNKKNRKKTNLKQKNIFRKNVKYGNFFSIL